MSFEVKTVVAGAELHVTSSGDELFVTMPDLGEAFALGSSGRTLRLVAWGGREDVLVCPGGRVDLGRGRAPGVWRPVLRGAAALLWACLACWAGEPGGQARRSALLRA